MDQSLRVERIVKGLIHGQEDVRACGRRILIFGFGAEFRTGKQITRAAEVGDELVDAGAAGRAREKDGIIQKAGGDTAPGIRIHSGEAQIGIGQECRAGFTDVLLGSKRTQSSDGDLRIVLEGDRFGLGQGQGRRGG